MISSPQCWANAKKKVLKMEGRDSPTSGIIYLAMGEFFLKQAEVSATSVRAHMPGLTIAVATEQLVNRDLFDLLLPVDRSMPAFRHKIKTMSSTPFDKTLFLDADTLLLCPLPEIFDVLDHFDVAMSLAARYAIRKCTRELHGVPVAYPDWNSGVIAYRKTQATEELFRVWDAEYEKLMSLGIYADQPSLRVACYSCKVRIIPLPRSYNYKLTSPGVVRGEVKLIHGPPGDILSTRDVVNMTGGMRVTVPMMYHNRIFLYGSRLKGVKKWVRRNFWKRLASLSRFRPKR